MSLPFLMPRVLSPETSQTSISQALTKCGCLHDGVIENGCARNPLTLCSVPVLVVQVWVHIPGDLQCVQLRNATKKKKKKKKCAHSMGEREKEERVRN